MRIDSHHHMLNIGVRWKHLTPLKKIFFLFGISNSNSINMETFLYLGGYFLCFHPDTENIF